VRGSAPTSACGAFKYYNFFIDQLERAARLAGAWAREDTEPRHHHAARPSPFFTVPGYIYVVDLYRGDLDSSRQLLDELRC